MSDMSQGPGWWIASDGRWYPPHLHPSVSVPPPTEGVVDQSDARPASSEPATGPGPTAWPGPTTSSGPAASSEPTGSAGPAGSEPPSEVAPRFVGPNATPTVAPFASPDAGTFAVDHGPGVPDHVGYPPPDPGHRKRSRTPAAAAVSIVVVVLLIVGAIFVFGGSKSASAQVIDAVNSTLQNGTAQVTMNLSGQAAGTSVTGTGTGGIDFRSNALQLKMTVGADGQQLPVTAIYLGGVIYESVPGLNVVAPGKSWLSLDLSSLQKAEAQDPSSQGLGSNPSVMLQMLAQQGNTVVPLGPSTVDGVAVNGYSVTVQPSAVAKQLKKANLPSWMQQAVSGLKVHTISIKVFVDHAGLLRSYEMQLSESTGTSGTFSFDETLGFSNYGTPVTVTAPPASQVESFQQLLQAAGAQGTTSS
jgi:hypothetical protein